jgi:hypothetical protein
MVQVDDNRALSIIMQRLQPGERLIWHGLPTPWRAAIPHLGILGFMTVWTGFALFTLLLIPGQASATDPPPTVVLLAIPLIFCAVGTATWLWTLKKIADCWRTAYGLTDRRIIIAVGESGSTDSYTGGAIESLKRLGDNRRGTLLFDYRTKGRGYGHNAAFHGIDEPARVEALIYKTLLLKETKGAAI